jgi:predicted regulator of Ras-like GTPase activity (Roadblock/LC7/MglB family)
MNPGRPQPHGTARASDIDWLLDELVDRVVGVDRLVLLSADGLLIASSRDVSKDDGDHLAAVASAFQSLARGAGRQFRGGRPRQTVVEMESAFLVVTAAGRGACLALLASVDVDLGVAAYELNVLVQRVGAFLGAAPRPDTDRVAGEYSRP